MKPACSLRITFSATSRVCAACGASNGESDRPPALPLSLWQPAQYRLMTGLKSCACDATGFNAGFAVAARATAGVAAGWTDGACAAAATTPRDTTTPPKNTRIPEFIGRSLHRATGSDLDPCVLATCVSRCHRNEKIEI